MKILKFFFFLTFLALAFPVLQAQPVAIGEPSILVASTGQNWIGPKWSPDGKFLAISSEGYNGIWILTRGEKEPRQISDEQGVGFGFSWSPDSDEVLVRASEYVGPQRLQSVKTINVFNSKVTTIVESTREIASMPSWVNGGMSVLAVVNQTPEVNSIESHFKGLDANHVADTYLYSIEGKMYVFSHEKDENREVADFGSRTIFNVTTSPSGKKVAFQVAAKGLFVINSDGSDLKHLGFGERPSWFPSEDYIAVMKTTDNGHNFTSGAIYSVCISTGSETSLFEAQGIIALSPSVAPDGKKIAFENHAKSDILVVDIQN
jgi:Tol biopolymer transport system component